MDDMGKLIEALHGWRADFGGLACDRCGGDMWVCFDKILSPYSTPKDEGHAVEVEPLAVLAGKKGWFIVDQYVCREGETSIGLRLQGEEGFAKVFNGPTYAAAEALVRSYLMALPDRNEGEK